MSDTPGIPRYSLRKRPTDNALSHPNLKSSHPCLPRRNAPSGVAPPTTPRSDPRRPTISPLTPPKNTPTRSHILFDSNPPADNTAVPVPHTFTINGETFTGPLPPNESTDPPGNAASIPGDHGGYMLFVCADCPAMSQENEEEGLHTLCYPSHPCIWSFPLKAREAFANRNHWLKLDKPLENTRRANGRLPRLLDEDGESITRGLRAVGAGRGFEQGLR